ncbi:hypothetical protein JI735_33680 (plasmid) [Paenibacillus sonchi]|uniref:Uncharacterized protein n=2 Tax=Paenibacillus sonchi TaxID=373687 RepID=A0A974SFH0_9BACL|nr:hypothetical protein [Paenibacillus sonchi]QQZ64603.1 hypothetical protein JI735_33680 [Paenibacillus sonchi]
MVKANLYKKLKEHASNVGRPLVGMRISIKGELYLEMDAEFLNNAQLGVIGFEAEALPDKLDKEPKATVKPLPPRTKSVPLINIAVDLMLIPKSPSTEEIEQEVSYYHQHKMFSRPIFIDKTKSGYRLRKGYLQFAAAKKLSLEEVDTLMFSSEMKVSWDDY